MTRNLRRMGALLLCACVLAGGLTSPPARAVSDEYVYDLTDFENDQVLAVYEDGTSEVFDYASQQALAAGVAGLTGQLNVAYVQPNCTYTVTGTAVSDPYYSQQWALHNDGSFRLVDGNNQLPVYDDPFDQPSWPWQWRKPLWQSSTQTGGTAAAVSGVDLNMEEAWARYDGGGSQTVIALIDTGVDRSHPEFGDIFWVNEDEIPGNGIDDDGNGYVDDRNGWNFYNGNSQVYTGTEDNHGTHGAGSIAATGDNGVGIVGEVSDGSVKIMVLKALGGKKGTGTTDAVIRAIAYAQANGATICNMSMGTDLYDQALYDSMASSNMLFVVSAGNDGVNADQVPTYPAGFDLDNVISVANVQADGTLHYSSNYGMGVDIAAPGTYILSLTTNDTYSYMTGTSMSAPLLSGVAAMVCNTCPGLTAREVRSILLETARPLQGLTGLVGTGGILNAGAALEAAQARAGSQAQSAGTETALPFTDLPPGHAAYEAVSDLYRRGVMAGTGATTFSPNATLTRGMVITLLGRLAQAEPQEMDAFSDVAAGTWYSGYVGWAVENGVVQGYGDGRFGPSDPVTGQQLDLILGRYAALLGSAYDSGLTSKTPLTRAETAQALYDFCQTLEL